MIKITLLKTKDNMWYVNVVSPCGNHTCLGDCRVSQTFPTRREAFLWAVNEGERKLDKLET